MVIARTVVNEQYAATSRTYNTAAERYSTSLIQERKKELKGYAAWNQKRSQKATTTIGPLDKLTKYRNIAKPPEGQDPLD